MTADRRPTAGTSPGRQVGPHWVLGPLAGATVLMAVVFHVQGWGSLPGGSCGSTYQACADGTGTLIVLAFVCTFVGAITLIVVLAALAKRGFGKAHLIALPLAGAVLIAWPGWQIATSLRGPMLDTAWTTPVDRPKETRVQGLWVTDDGTVVRGREDALIAHGPNNGERRWSADAPARMSLCSMSGTVPQGIGIVAHQRHEKPCASVSAVDLDSGRTLWKRTVDASDRHFTRAQGGRVAADGEVAVTATRNGARAFGLRDGKPRWSYRADDGDCGPALVSAAGGRTRIVEVCDPLGADKVTTRVVTLDSGDGKELRRQDLPTETGLSAVEVLSAEPLVIQVAESDERGLDAVLAFDGKGDEPVVVKRVGADEELALGAVKFRYPARPGLNAVVHGDTLFAVTRTTGGDWPQHVSAYSLRDGQRQWRVRAADNRRDSVDSLAVADGRIGVYVDDGRILALDPRSGAKQHDHGAVIDEGTMRIGSDVQLVAGPGDDWILVNPEAGEYPPLLRLTPKD